GAFPVRRGVADSEAIRVAIDILRKGEQMIVFPEGTRQSGPQVTGVFDGTTYLASRSGAAIVVVGIAGTEDALPAGRRLPRRARVALVATEPIRLPEGRLSRREVSTWSEVVSRRLQAAFDEAHELARGSS
ncbi:MAG: lysophospholipid acyltransferase family protein, partial [Acidimicrobiales bacterium]